MALGRDASPKDGSETSIIPINPFNLKYHTCKMPQKAGKFPKIRRLLHHHTYIHTPDYSPCRFTNHLSLASLAGRFRHRPGYQVSLWTLGRTGARLTANYSGPMQIMYVFFFFIYPFYSPIFIHLLISFFFFLLKDPFPWGFKKCLHGPSSELTVTGRSPSVNVFSSDEDLRIR